MGKITFTSKRNTLTILNRLVYPEAVNERVYREIEAGKFDGTLILNRIDKKKETRLECILEDMQPLYEYFECIVSKQMFLDVVYKIVSVLECYEKARININSCDLEQDRIFVDPNTLCVYCLYWPIVNNQREASPGLFFRQLPYDLQFTNDEDLTYIEEYNNYFNRNIPFSVSDFKKLISRLLGKPVDEDIHTPSGALSSSQDYVRTNIKDKSPREYDPLGARKGKDMLMEHKANNEHESLFCTQCGFKNKSGAKFCRKCGSPMAGNKVFENNCHVEEKGTTTVLGGFDKNSLNNAEAKLMRLRSGISYTVNKECFTIGALNSDINITDNQCISKRHAHIVAKNNRYYIVDDNSTNSTYVDGKKIIPGEQVELYSDTIIRLANDEFKFTIEM